MLVFERGDIVVVNLEPVVGHEMQGSARPALVLSSKLFNRMGDVLVAPITQGGDFARHAGFAVSLTGTGCKTQGVALINKMRMMDLVVPTFRAFGECLSSIRLKFPAWRGRREVSRVDRDLLTGIFPLKESTTALPASGF